MASFIHSGTEPITESRYYTYVERHVPFDHVKYRNNKVALGMQMWIGWHTFLLQFHESGMYSYKLEDLSGQNGDDRQAAVVGKIFTSIRRKAPSAAFIKRTLQELSAVDPDHHHRKHRATLTWDELFRADKELAMEAWNLSLKFGYEYDFDPNNFTPGGGAVPHC